MEADLYQIAIKCNFGWGNNKHLNNVLYLTSNDRDLKTLYGMVHNQFNCLSLILFSMIGKSGVCLAEQYWFLKSSLVLGQNFTENLLQLDRDTLLL